MIDLHRQIMLNSIRDFLHTKMKVIWGEKKVRIENTHKRMQQGEKQQKGTRTEEFHEKRHNRETQRKKKQIEKDTEKEQGT